MKAWKRNGFCAKCGDSNPHRLTRHHVLPVRWFGRKHNNRKVILCSDCHRDMEAILTEAEGEPRRCLTEAQYEKLLSDFLE